MLAVLTAVLGVGRLTRLITYDDYPPTAWFRRWWIQKVTRGNGWGKLADCQWCCAPWIMLVCIGWFLLGPVSPAFVWSWWLFWSWLGLAYAVSMVVVRDEPPE